MPETTDAPKEKIYYDQRSVALRTPQSIYFVQEHDKIAMIGLLLNEYKNIQVLIVVKSKKKADALSTFLISKDLNALAVHGNHRASQQQEAGVKFNEGSLNIIITTDMILKTLGLENIKLVLNYDLAEDTQVYYNRLALMKEQGIAISLISPEDESFLSDIEVNMKVEIEERKVEEFVPTDGSAKQTKKKKKPRHGKNKAKK